MSPFAFDAAIAIGRHESIPHPDHSITRYHVDIQKRFNAGGAPFGGIIFAATLNALVSDFNGTRWPHPLSAQCTFLSIAQTAPAYVDVRRLKEGGRSAVSEAVLRQDQPTKSGGYETVDILSVVATFGDLRNEEGPEYVTGKRPEVEWDEQGLEWKPSPETPGVGMQVSDETEERG